MRITKKFTGDSCIGKRVFQPLSRFVSNYDASNANSTSTSADVNKDTVGNSSVTGNGSDSKYPAIDGDRSRKYLDEFSVSDETDTHTDQIDQNNIKITVDKSSLNTQAIQNPDDSCASNVNSSVINYANCGLIDNSRKELRTLRRIWLEKMLSAEREQARKNCVKSSSSIKHNSGRNKVIFFIFIFIFLSIWIFILCVDIELNMSFSFLSSPLHPLLPFFQALMMALEGSFVPSSSEKYTGERRTGD